MEEAKQLLELQNRSSLHVSAVKEIISFKENAAELDTALGRLQITGKDLHVDKVDLETGILILSGRVNSLYYPEEEPLRKKGLLSRIWG